MTDSLNGTPTLDDRSSDRRRSNTDVMRRGLCANGWLVDACRWDHAFGALQHVGDRDAVDRVDISIRSHGSIT